METRRVVLNDRILKALKPTHGKPYDVRDAVLPGLRARVMGSGQVSFVLLGRFGSPNPTRRALGNYPAMSLAEARAKAKKWLELIDRGIDPAVERERERLAQAERRKNTFVAVVADFIADKLPSERAGRKVEREIRKDLVPLWGALPISEITDLHILSIVKAKKRTAPGQARNLLGTIKRLFTWAVDQRCYGLSASPCRDLKASRIIGEKPIGDRILTDDEWFALWRVTGRLGYPHGPAYRLLMLTALRLNEVGRAHWSEFDLSRKLWIIPKERMKGRNTKARAHAVPLTPDMLAILQSLPRFNRGQYLFSTRFGAKPASIDAKVKARVDNAMLRTLRAMARHRGDDPDLVTLPAWTNHDIRRSVRSQLSRLKIAEEAREAVLAHVRPGIKGTYDHHDYLPEKREALEAWDARLRTIVEPPPANVIDLTARA